MAGSSNDFGPSSSIRFCVIKVVEGASVPPGAVLPLDSNFKISAAFDCPSSIDNCP